MRKTRLLVCKVGGLGDTVSMLPLVCGAAARFDVTMLCSPVGREVLRVLAPHARRVVVGRAALRRWRGGLVAPLLAARIGPVGAAALSYDETSAAYITARLCTAKTIGFRSQIARAGALLTRALPFEAGESVYHQTDRLCAALGVEAAAIPRTHRAGGYGLIHPGAATGLQIWPQAALMAGRLRHRFGFPWRVINAPVPMRSLIDLVRGAEGILCQQSGPLHLAAALGTPVVAVAGPTARAWDPPHGRVLRAGLPCQPCGRLGRPAIRCNRAMACLTGVDPEQVMAALAEEMGR